MHPFAPVPRAPQRRRELRGRGRATPARRVRVLRTAVLAALATAALVTVPAVLAPPPSGSDRAVGSGQQSDVQALRETERAGRSGAREPTSTTSPSATDGATTPPGGTPATTTTPSATQPAVPAAPPTEPTASTEPGVEPAADPTVADEIVTRTNAERAAAGLAPFTVSTCATEQAEARTALLVAQDRFEHDPLEPVLTACGAHAVGENLALGYPTPRAVVAGWMGSDGHRANILNPTYTQIGVACTPGAHGQLCGQVFLG